MEKEIKKVTLVLRDGWDINTPTVEVLWECPVCGDRMGDDVTGHNFYEDGISYHCNVWNNPCGHTANYSEVKMKQEDGLFISWDEIKERRNQGI